MDDDELDDDSWSWIPDISDAFQCCYDSGRCSLPSTVVSMSAMSAAHALMCLGAAHFLHPSAKGRSHCREVTI